MFNKKRKPHKLKNSYGSLLFQLFITIVGFSSVIFFVGEDVDSAIIIGGIMGIALAFITRFFIIYKRNKKNKEKKDNIPEVVLFIWQLLALEIYILKIVNLSF